MHKKIIVSTLALIIMPFNFLVSCMQETEESSITQISNDSSNLNHQGNTYFMKIKPWWILDGGGKLTFHTAPEKQCFATVPAKAFCTGPHGLSDNTDNIFYNRTIRFIKGIYNNTLAECNLANSEPDAPVCISEKPIKPKAERKTKKQIEVSQRNSNIEYYVLAADTYGGTHSHEFGIDYSTGNNKYGFKNLQSCENYKKRFNSGSRNQLNSNDNALILISKKGSFKCMKTSEFWKEWKVRTHAKPCTIDAIALGWC